MPFVCPSRNIWSSRVSSVITLFCNYDYTWSICTICNCTYSRIEPDMQSLSLPYFFQFVCSLQCIFINVRSRHKSDFHFCTLWSIWGKTLSPTLIYILSWCPTCLRVTALCSGNTELYALQLLHYNVCGEGEPISSLLISVTPWSSHSTVTYAGISATSNSGHMSGTGVQKPSPLQ